MIADGRYEQNLFCFPKELHTLYIGLSIKVPNQVHAQQMEKKLPTNVILVWYEFPNGTITGSKVTYKE